MLRTVIDAAKTGAKVVLDSISKDTNNRKIDIKSANDFVTEVDRRSQETIVNLILKRYPHHAILAEETGGGVEGREFRWIIDPLDGTNNFIHGFPVFAVSVAVEQYYPELDGFGEILCGAVVNPLNRQVYHAEAGKGAYLDGKRINVSGRVNLSECLAATGFPFREKEYLDEFLRIFKRVFNSVSGIRRAGAAALDLCWIADGSLDCFWEKGLSPWDMAAGALLIREAGGKITDFNGENRFLETGNIVACTPAVHEQMLKFISS